MVESACIYVRLCARARARGHVIAIDYFSVFPSAVCVGVRFWWRLFLKTRLYYSYCSIINIIYYIFKVINRPVVNDFCSHFRPVLCVKHQAHIKTKNL